MKLSATLRIALRALRRNKMRSVLTMLGIIIGVGAVIAMVGVGNGAKSQVEAQIATLGKNMILIFSGSMTSSGVKGGGGAAGTMKIEDAVAIAREIPGVTMVSPEIRSFVQVAAGNQNWFTRCSGRIGRLLRHAAVGVHGRVVLFRAGHSLGQQGGRDRQDHGNHDFRRRRSGRADHPREERAFPRHRRAQVQGLFPRRQRPGRCLHRALYHRDEAAHGGHHPAGHQRPGGERR